MMIPLRCFLLLLVLIEALHAQLSVDISGTIKNQADYFVKDMIVSLSGKGLSDTTKADGKFRIAVPMSSVLAPSIFPSAGVEIHCSQIEVIVPDRKPVSLDMYTLGGAHIVEILNNQILPQGRWSYPLPQLLHNVTASVLLLIMRHGEETFSFRIINAGQENYSISSLGKLTVKKTGTQVGGNVPVVDTLKFFRKVFVVNKEVLLQEYAFPVDKLVEEFDVTLDLVPYESIVFGVKEIAANRIWPDLVGDTLKEYPFAIRNYLQKIGNGIHDYQWWCSEYYSYVLRLGGYPFTSNMNPPWMINANMSIKSWFETNRKYITTSTIGSFRPLPGDFCHMVNHAAMVWFITDKDSLFTVEANGDLDGDGLFDNKLSIVNRGNYKSFSGLLGYGQITGFVKSSHKPKVP